MARDGDATGHAAQHPRSMQSRYVNGLTIRPLRAGDTDTVARRSSSASATVTSRRRRSAAAKRGCPPPSSRSLARVDADHHVLVAYLRRRSGGPPGWRGSSARTDGGGRVRGRRRAARPRHRLRSCRDARGRRARCRHRRAPCNCRLRQRTRDVPARPRLEPPRTPRGSAPSAASSRPSNRRHAIGADMGDSRPVSGLSRLGGTSMSSQPEGALRRAVFLAVTLVGLVFVPLAGSAQPGQGWARRDSRPVEPRRPRSRAGTRSLQINTSGQGRAPRPCTSLATGPT